MSRGSVQGYEIVLTGPIAGSSSGVAAGPGTSNTPGVLSDSIPASLRSTVEQSRTTKTSYTYATIRYAPGSGKVAVPGVVTGSQVTLPADGGTYTLYYLFPMTEQQETLTLVRRALVTGGALLLVLVGGLTWLVTRQVVTPVRLARRVAERLASGRLEERMHVRGDDDIARLGTSFNQMAASLQKQIRQLEELSRVQRRFVSDVSHELRTPLTTVRMAGDVLHDARDRFDPPTARAAELLQNELDRFEMLLGDLLEISRFDAGAAVLDLEDVNLVDLAHRVVESTRALAERARHRGRRTRRGRGRAWPRSTRAASSGSCATWSPTRSTTPRARTWSSYVDVRRGRHRARRARPRRRPAARRRGDGVQPVLAGRPGPRPHHRRHRARPLDLAGGRAPARRLAAGVGRAGRRRAVPADPAAPGRATGSAPARCRWSRRTPGLGKVGGRYATAEPRPERPRGGPQGGHPVTARRVLVALLALLALGLSGCVSLPRERGGPVGDRRGPGRQRHPRRLHARRAEEGQRAGPAGRQLAQGDDRHPAEHLGGAAVPHLRQPPRLGPRARHARLRQPLADQPARTARSGCTSATWPRSTTAAPGSATRPAARAWTSSCRLVKDDGEWRISRPPNRLVIPLTHFDTQYQQYFLYFFDKSGQTLVPEPVYVPRGLQAPTLLVSALLKGPLDGRCEGVEGTFVPAGTRLDGLSVPVSRDGTAEVPLSDQVLDVDDNQLNLLFAQLAWTLGQIAGVERMRVTVGGTPVDLPGARADVGVNQWSEFDPALAWASTALFGIRDGRVVTLTGDQERRVGGPFGSLALGLRSIAVDLPAQHVAGVTTDGTRVLEADKERRPAPRAWPTCTPCTPAARTCCGPPTTSTARCGCWTAPRSGARLSVRPGGLGGARRGARPHRRGGGPLRAEP